MPFRIVIHDFFVEKEMEWVIGYSKPRLTKSRREMSNKNSTSDNPQLRGQVSKRTTHKAVTTWFNCVKYKEVQRYELSKLDMTSMNKAISVEAKDLRDPYSFEVEHATMLSISRRIEIATQLNVTTRFGASDYQSTRYGLSGMVIVHADPWGYESGNELEEDRISLVSTGDYIATFMGWLGDTDAGGMTAFTSKHFEGTVAPRKGSAAFWINLASSHQVDERSEHGGCPVLKGSKWILNKWIFSWDQWKELPCDVLPYRTIKPFKGMSN